MLKTHATASRIAALLLAASLPFVSGCGKKGPPRPPIKLRPQTVSDLELRQRGRTIFIDFTLPVVSTTGAPLGRGLAEVEVFKLRMEEPAAAPTPTPTEGEGTAAAPPRGRFIPTYDFLKKADRIASIARADFPRYAKGATAGATLTPGSPEVGLALEVKDELVTEPIGGESPHRLYYAVRVEDTDGHRSDLSNIDSLVPLTPPSPPGNLTAAIEDGRVKLDWEPPGTGPAPAGYRVFRILGEGEAKALSPAPMKGTERVDAAPASGSVTYLVRSSATLDKPYVESEDAATVTLKVKDSTPPDAPQGLRAAAGPGKIELFWERSPSPDAAGYNVYRADKRTGPFEKMNEKLMPETLFSDIGTKGGVTYYYAVTAVDRSGNESDRSEVVPGRR